MKRKPEYVVMMGQCFLSRMTANLLAWSAEYPDAHVFSDLTDAMIARDKAWQRLLNKSQVKIVMNYGTEQQKEMFI